MQFLPKKIKINIDICLFFPPSIFHAFDSLLDPFFSVFETKQVWFFKSFPFLKLITKMQKDYAITFSLFFPSSIFVIEQLIFISLFAAQEKTSLSSFMSPKNHLQAPSFCLKSEETLPFLALASEAAKKKGERYLAFKAVQDLRHHHLNPVYNTVEASRQHTLTFHTFNKEKKKWKLTNRWK